MAKETNRRKKVLKAIRESLGKDETQQKTATSINMSIRAYQDVEVGGAVPNLSRAVSICARLGIPLKVFCEAKGIDVSGLPDDNGLSLEEFCKSRGIEVSDFEGE